RCSRFLRKFDVSFKWIRPALAEVITRLEITSPELTRRHPDTVTISASDICDRIYRSTGEVRASHLPARTLTRRAKDEQSLISTGEYENVPILYVEVFNATKVKCSWAHLSVALLTPDD